MDPDIFSVNREGSDCGVSSELIELVVRAWRGGIGNLLAIVPHCAIRAWQGGHRYMELCTWRNCLAGGISILSGIVSHCAICLSVNPTQFRQVANASLMQTQFDLCRMISVFSG